MQLLRFPAALGKLRGTAYVSIIDTGVQNPNGLPHAELARALRPQLSTSRMQAASGHLFTSGDIDEGAQYPDYRGHGTHVAGIIVAQADGQGVSGGCPECALMVQAVQTTDAIVGAAILDAVARGVQVANLSLGVPIDGTLYKEDSYCTTHPTMPPCNALAIAVQRELVLVASSGNDRFHVQFPANQSGVMAIGGLEFVSQTPTAAFWTTPQSAILPDFPGPTAFPDCMVNGNPSSSTEGGSNCGPTQFLVAPARNVLSTLYGGYEWEPFARCMDMADGANPQFVGPSQTYAAEPDYLNGYVEYVASGYGTCTGTSMSAPHVTAAAALVRSSNPLLNASDIRRILQRHASGNDTRLDDRMGYGYPFVDNAVIAGLSGASLSNPTAFDATVKNRLTPLFSLYSGTARNHVYTIAPQMAVAAINGTLVPSPAYRLNQNSANVTCSPPCNNMPVVPAPAFQILSPDNSPASGVPLYLAQDPAFGNGSVTPSSLVAVSTSTGTVPTGMAWTYSTVDINVRSARIGAALQSSYPITYARVGNTIAGYPYFPSITTYGSNPKSTLSVYVSHVNPLASGPDMVPLYRMSGRCGEVASSTCDNVGGTGYNPFHVSHRYTTSETGKSSLAASGYKLDGIEGYLFAKTYTNAPISGAVRVCRLLDPVSDEMILFPATGSNGKSCNPPFPSYASNSYYSTQLDATDWIGWGIPNYGGNTPPSVSITNPTNGATLTFGSPVTLSASASDSSGIGNVRFYANGALVATDNTSPYSKSWTPSAPGSYKIHAVATDMHTTPWAATSNPVQITVGSCPNTIPTVANGGFETPALPLGTYDDAPAGASWTFVPVWGGGQSGISANGSVFTDHNPNAPAGTQVAYIQGANTISQVINFPSCGVYRVRISAAQRDPFYNQSTLGIELYVDGAKIGTTELTPPDRNYSTRTSAQFSVTAGNHTILFQGVNNGYDNSVFIDSIQVISP